MPAKRDAAWWRDYRARKRMRGRSEGPHAACDRVEAELRQRIRELEGEVRRLNEPLF